MVWIADKGKLNGVEVIAIMLQNPASFETLTSPLCASLRYGTWNESLEAYPDCTKEML